MVSTDEKRIIPVSFGILIYIFKPAQISTQSTELNKLSC